MAARTALCWVMRDDHDVAEIERPVRVTHRAMLGEVRFWSEAEWSALPAADRPREPAHKPGVGWIAMVAVACMN